MPQRRSSQSSPECVGSAARAASGLRGRHKKYRVAAPVRRSRFRRSCGRCWLRDPAAVVLMKTSVYPHLVAFTGIPLRQTINESDKEFYSAALAAPATHAAIVLAFDGDEIDRAVKAHPAGLATGAALCSFPASRPARFTSPIPRRAQQTCTSGDSIGQGNSHVYDIGQYFAQPFDFSWLQQTRRGQRRHRPPAGRLPCWAASSAWSAKSSASSAGVRTNLLICMGAASSPCFRRCWPATASPNKGQVASNIVQGIGFLGAGLIIHNRSRVSGLTSAASVWVVASIGMACGAGLLAPRQSPPSS